ncbi:MAG: hypothetical protein IKD05_02065 [Tidjanibacter sp.]|nr:hypothetical protein [Tidjanibacter sp.]
MKRTTFKMTKLWSMAAMFAAVLMMACQPEPTPGPNPGPDVVIPDVSQIDLGKSWPLISTIPSFVAPDATDNSIIVVNVAGSTVKEGEELWAHTGVITSASTSGSDWKYVKHSWTQNEPDCKLTHVDGTIYAMTIAGGPRAFYGVPEGEEIERLAFVFRNATGTKEVKNNGQDIYLDLVAADELAVRVLSPAHGTIYPIGATVPVVAVSQNAASLVLTLNGSEVGRSDSNEVNYTHTITAGGDMVFEATATAADGSTAVASVTAASLKNTESKARPTGAKDGVTVGGTEATVVLYAPGKEQIILLGDFNKFAPSNNYVMYKDGDYFWTTISGLQPETEYAYQFLVDGKIKVGDPYCEKILDPWNDKWINQYNVIYPDLKPFPTETTDIVSVFTTSTKEYNWTVTDFVRPDKNSLAVYELLFRDFTPEGSVQAAIAKLDYLADLGINAIELMPIQEFDGNNSWGYNPCFYFAPDKAYGTKDDYKQFVDECHKRGIAVILDIVLNHATGQFPWMKMWSNDGSYPNAQNPFFNVTAKHPFNVYNDINHNNPKTREYFADMLKFWLTEYKIDGYRFDLAKGITQTNSGNNDTACRNYDSNRISHLKYYYDAMQQASEGSYMILEYFVCDQEENEMANYGALPWRNSIGGYQQSIMGWTDPSSNFSSAYAKNRVSYMESHDEPRVAWKALQYGNTGVKDWANLSKRIQGAMALHFLTPYPKMMWQGGELGDARELAEGDARTEKKLMQWEKLSDPNIKALYDACCKIISFRTDHPELYGNGASQNCATYNVSDSSMGGKHLVYSQGNTAVIVVANFLAGSSSSSNTTTTPSVGSSASFVTTTPEVVLNSTTEDVVVMVDASNSPLAGATEIYAHTGVITNNSSGNADWKYVKADWKVNTADCKLTKVEGNKWKLVIKGGPKAFYGVPAHEHINKLAFVFRSADGTKELKNAGSDIFVTLGDAQTAIGGSTSPDQEVSFDLAAPNGTYTNLITGEKVTVSDGLYHNSLKAHEYVVLVKE